MQVLVEKEIGKLEEDVKLVAAASCGGGGG